MFQIKTDSDIIIYAPLQGKVFTVDEEKNNFLVEIKEGKELSDLVIEENQEFLTQLTSWGLVTESPIIRTFPEANSIFKPTNVTLFPTSLCNLVCVYCYASAGSEALNLDINIARAGIDLAVKNAIEQKEKRVRISLHGGGEPTLRIDFINEITNYAKHLGKANDLRITFSTVTNGCMNDEQLKWVLENKPGLTFSFDGPREIQESQRPTRNGTSSYDWALSNFKEIHKQGIKFAYRPTITKASADMLPEMMDFFKGLKMSNRVHVEPLSECGRCTESNQTEPQAELYVKKFLEAQKRAEQIGINLYTAENNFGKPSLYFCGALQDTFSITPQGFVSSCYEATKTSDSTSKIFFYGKYNKGTNQFDIDKDKLLQLRSRSANNIAYCGKCVAKYDCKGGCPAKSDDLFKPNQYQCNITQEFIKDKLVTMVDKAKKGE